MGLQIRRAPSVKFRAVTTLIAIFALVAQPLYGLVSYQVAHAARSGTTRYVKASANDDTGNDCRDESNPCSLLKSAIAVADSGDTIDVTGGSGVYSDMFKVDKELHFVGHNNPIISNSSSAPESYVMRLDIGATGTTIDGFTFEIRGAANDGLDIATAGTLDGLEVTNNKFITSGAAPRHLIYAGGMTNSTFSGNNFTNFNTTAASVYVENYSTSGNTWSDNVFTGSTNQLVFGSEGSNLTFEGNDFSGVTISGKDKIVELLGQNNTATGNIFNQSQPAISVYGSGSSYKGTFTTFDLALSKANVGDTIVLESDIITPSQVTLNKQVVIDGGGHTISTSGANHYLFLVKAADISIRNLNIVKTDSATPQNIIGLQAPNAVIDHVNFSGQYSLGDAEVSRAIEVSAAGTGFTFSNNTVKQLRQPGYVNRDSRPGNVMTGTISGNTVSGSKGWWVASDSNLTFTNNAWSGNDPDISINSDGNTVNRYTCSIMLQIRANNNNANIDNKLLNINTCDASKPTGVINVDKYNPTTLSFDAYDDMNVDAYAMTIWNSAGAKIATNAGNYIHAGNNWGTHLYRDMTNQMVKPATIGSPKVDIATLPDGEYTVKLQVIDASGKQNSNISATFIVDHTAPKVEIISPVQSDVFGGTNNSKATIKLKITDPSGVDLTKGTFVSFGRSADLTGSAKSGSVNYKLTPVAGEPDVYEAVINTLDFVPAGSTGRYGINYRAQDTLGNGSSGAHFYEASEPSRGHGVRLLVDNAAPVITIKTPTDNADAGKAVYVSNSQAIIISGTATDVGAGVVGQIMTVGVTDTSDSNKVLVSQHVAVQADGSWSVTVPAGTLPNGHHMIISAATRDKAAPVYGNVGSDHAYFVVDTTKPTISNIKAVVNPGTSHERTVSLVGKNTSLLVKSGDKVTVTIKVDGTGSDVDWAKVRAYEQNVAAGNWHTYLFQDQAMTDNGNGTYSYTFTVPSEYAPVPDDTDHTINEGQYKNAIDFNVRDKAGNTRGTELYFTVDNTSPTIDSIQIMQKDKQGNWQVVTGRSINNRNIRVQWSSGNSDVDHYEYVNATGSHDQGMSTHRDGKIGGTKPDSDIDGNTYTYCVYAVDKAGNKGDKKCTEVTVDLTPPVIEDVTFNGSSYVKNMSLSGTVDFSATINDTVSGIRKATFFLRAPQNTDTSAHNGSRFAATGTLTKGSDGRWHASFDTKSFMNNYLADGDYQLIINTWDKAGTQGNHTASGSMYLTIDNTTPGEPVITPDSSTTPASGSAFTMTVAPAATDGGHITSVTINGVSQTLSTDGTYTIDTTGMQKGANVTVVAVAEDTAGNSATTTTIYHVNNGTPAIAAGALTSDDTGNFTLSGTSGYGEGAGVIVTDQDGNEYTGTTNADGSWHVYLGRLLADTDYTFSVFITNSLGYDNTTEASYTTPTVDTNARVADLGDSNLTNTVAYTGPAVTLQPTQTTGGDAQAPAVLGTKTTGNNQDAAVLAATPQGWKVFGLAWYWWLLILAIIVSIVWWIIAAARRRAAEDAY